MSAIVAVPGRRLVEGVLEITTRTAYRNFQAANRPIHAVEAPAVRRSTRTTPRSAGLTTDLSDVTVRVETDMEPDRNFRGPDVGGAPVARRIESSGGEHRRRSSRVNALAHVRSPGHHRVGGDRLLDWHRSHERPVGRGTIGRSPVHGRIGRRSLGGRAVRGQCRAGRVRLVAHHDGGPRQGRLPGDRGRLHGGASEREDQHHRPGERGVQDQARHARCRPATCPTCSSRGAAARWPSRPTPGCSRTSPRTSRPGRARSTRAP